MGKKRLAEVRSKEVNNHKSLKEKIDMLREIAGNIKADTHDTVVMKSRVKMAETRWMPYQGITRLEDLDLSDPQISLEWKLTDPAVLKDLLEPGGRDRLFAILTEEEKDVYLNKTDTNGARYTDLETAKSGFTKANVGRAILHIKQKA